MGAVPPAHGFTPVTGDFNGDCMFDIFVANDSDPTARAILCPLATRLPVIRSAYRQSDARGDNG
jgi:hypothetical protein